MSKNNSKLVTPCTYMLPFYVLLSNATETTQNFHGILFTTSLKKLFPKNLKSASKLYLVSR